MDETKKYPGFGQSLLLLLMIIGIALGLVVLLLIIDAMTSINFLEHPAGLGIFNLICIGAVILIGGKKAGAGFQEVFPLQPISVSLLAGIMVSVAGMSILISELDNLVQTFLPIPEVLQKIFEELLSGENGLWATVLAVIIIAPLTEEFLFRGLFLRGFLSRYPTKTAIVASAFLFGFFHFNPWQFVGAFIVGIVFGWWYIKTKNLMPCLVGHALFNGIPVTLIGILKLEIPGYSSTSAIVEFQPVWLNLTGVILTVVGLWLLNQIFQKNDGSPNNLLQNDD